MSDLFGNHIVGFPTRWLISWCRQWSLMLYHYVTALPLGCVHIEIYGIRYMVFAIRYSVFVIRYTGTAVHIEVARSVEVCSFREYEKVAKDL